MHCVSETQALPPVQVFDKTMVVKQMHVLEPQDLLITRADKGRKLSTSSLHHHRIPPARHRPLSSAHSPCFCSRTFCIYSTSSSLVIPTPPSHFISVISLCVVEYLLTLSTSAGPVNTLITRCDLRKLTYREPIPVKCVCVCVFQRLCACVYVRVCVCVCVLSSGKGSTVSAAGFNDRYADQQTDKMKPADVKRTEKTQPVHTAGCCVITHICTICRMFAPTIRACNPLPCWWLANPAIDKQDWLGFDSDYVIEAETFVTTVHVCVCVWRGFKFLGARALRSHIVIRLVQWSTVVWCLVGGCSKHKQVNLNAGQQQCGSVFVSREGRSGLCVQTELAQERPGGEAARQEQVWQPGK